MASRKRIDAYRVRRPDTALSDDMIAWELDHTPDCAAEIPAEFKAELERIAWEDEDRPPPIMGGASAPLSLYDYASSPHGGKWKPLPDHGGEPAIAPRTHIHHSIVGSAAGAWGYFANSTSLESTNIVLKSGYLWQCMSRREQADANYRANDFAISTETEDNGHPDTDPWTPEQLDTLVWVTLSDIADFAIPRRECPAWDAAGVGYHSLFPGVWSNVAGKTCPGTIRIRQWRDAVLPRVLQTLEEDDMPFTRDEIKAMVREVLNEGTAGGQTSWATTSKATLRVAQETWNEAKGANDQGTTLEAIASRVTAIEGDVDRLAAALIPPAGSVP